jgi:5-methylcytosine-specific restriction endonuclease McrA
MSENFMAANNGNNRGYTKWVRDRAKAAYTKESSCCICGTAQDLELHHFHSITLLVEKWAKEKGYNISTDEGILAVRDEFIAEHHSELYTQVRTLCNKHHVNLHRIFGKSPAPNTHAKQERWVDLQKAKYEGKVLVEEKPKGSFFSAFT